MHEIALCQSVRDMLETEATQQGFTQVLRISVAIGALACVEKDAFEFGFASVMRGSLAEHAILDIIDVPAQAWCAACQTTSVIEQRYSACPHCGNVGLDITDGTQLRVVELEVS